MMFLVSFIASTTVSLTITVDLHGAELLILFDDKEHPISCCLTRD